MDNEYDYDEMDLAELETQFAIVEHMLIIAKSGCQPDYEKSRAWAINALRDDKDLEASDG